MSTDKPKPVRRGITIPPTPKQVNFVRNLRAQVVDSITTVPNADVFEEALANANRSVVSGWIDALLAETKKIGVAKQASTWRTSQAGHVAPPKPHIEPKVVEPAPRVDVNKLVSRYINSWNPKSLALPKGVIYDSPLFDSILVVDVSNIYARSAYKLPELEHAGRKTGGIYGLFTSVASTWNLVSDKFKCRPQVIFAYEAGGAFRRKALLPEYKSQRKPGSFWQNVDDEDLIKLMACQSGVISAWLQGGEADDAIAAIAQDATQPVFIMSNDKDMLRLTCFPTVTVIRSGNEFVDRAAFVAKYGYEPEHDIMVKALAGGDDDWPGIRGVGAKGAVNIMRDASWYWHLVLQHPKVAPHADAVRNAVEVMSFYRPNDETGVPVACRAYGTIAPSNLIERTLGFKKSFNFA